MKNLSSAFAVLAALFLLTCSAWGQQVKYYPAGEIPSAADIAKMLETRPATAPAAKPLGRRKSICDDCDNAPETHTALTAAPEAGALPAEQHANTATVHFASMQAPLEPSPPQVRAFALPISFNFDSYQIDASSYAALDQIAAGMNMTNKVVEVQGHTDATGTHEWNVTLSQKRAEAVKQYLVRKGVQANRLIVTGFAATRPLEPANPYAAINRRVQFTWN